MSLLSVHVPIISTYPNYQHMSQLSPPVPIISTCHNYKHMSHLSAHIPNMSTCPIISTYPNYQHMSQLSAHVSSISILRSICFILVIMFNLPFIIFNLLLVDSKIVPKLRWGLLRKGWCAKQMCLENVFGIYVRIFLCFLIYFSPWAVLLIFLTI